MHQAVQGLGEGCKHGVGSVTDLANTAFGSLSRCEEQNRVARRGIAVDGDAIECPISRGREKSLQHRLRNRSIGEHEAEHGRHIRSDHAGTLAEPGERHLARLHGYAPYRELGIGVRRHDCPRRILPAVRTRRSCEVAKQMSEPRRVHWLADDARGGEVNFFRLATDSFCRGLGRDHDGFVAFAPSEGVGIAGVDHQGSCTAVLELLTAPQDRRRARFGSCRDACRDGAG